MMGIDGDGDDKPLRNAEGEAPVVDAQCNEALTAMYLFLDNEQLTEAQRAHVQKHLDECIPCLESFEFEAEFKQLIKQRCRDEMPASLYERVRMCLKVEINSNKKTSSPNSE
jgi:mycothiol system anti-sigma-R factor